MNWNKHLAKIISTVVIIVILSGCQDKTQATENANFPTHCVVKQIRFSREHVTLATHLMPPAQQLYLIHNSSDQPIWLNHPLGPDPGASAGWGTQLSANHWSAIALSQANFVLSCQNAQFKPIACAKAIKVCQMIPAKFPQNLQGSFWAAENKPLQDLLDEIKTRGIEY